MHLKKVDVRTSLPDGADRIPFFASTMIEMVECLAICKKLQLLSFRSALETVVDPIDSRMSSIADACVRFRGRIISVKLDEKEYNP